MNKTFKWRERNWV